jgi:hypothetical protein
VTLQVAQTGRQAVNIVAEDIVELPDLGAAFNDMWVWRYYARMAQEEKKASDYA